MSVFYSDMVRKMKRHQFIPVILVFFLINASVVSSQPMDRQPMGPEVVLPDELQQLTIAEEFVSSDTDAVGHIQTAMGHVVVLHGDKRTAYVAAGGDPLFKEDVIFTLADSRCRIQFSTEDLITMGADTRVGIEAFIDSAATGEKSSIFKILRGKAMFYATGKYPLRSTHPLQLSVSGAPSSEPKFGSQKGMKLQHRSPIWPMLPVRCCTLRQPLRHRNSIRSSTVLKGQWKFFHRPMVSVRRLPEAKAWR